MDTNVGIVVLVISIICIIFWNQPLAAKTEKQPDTIKNDEVVTIDELMENTDTLYMITAKDTIKIYK